jgi:hypothetical protein
MIRSAWRLENVFYGVALLLLVSACQSTQNSSSVTASPSGTTAESPKQPVEASPTPITEQDSFGAPVSLTPQSAGNEQLAANSPSASTSVWNGPRTDNSPADPLSQGVTDPCREQGSVQDGTFVSATSNVQLGSDQQGWQGTPSPRIGSLTRRVPSALYSPTMRALTLRFLGVNSARSSSRKATTNTELLIAEKSAITGGMPIRQLRRLYQQFPFTPEELNAPFTDAEKDNSPRRRALLYRAATAQQVPTAIAEVLKIALKLARQQKLYSMTVELYGPFIKRFRASYALRWIGYEAGPAQFLLGQACDAKKWRRYLENIAPTDPHARKTLKRYWLLEALSGVVKLAKLDMQEVKTWRGFVHSQGPGAARRKIQLAYLMLDALGMELPVKNWSAVINSAGGGSSGGNFTELDQAAAQSQGDEVVAFAAMALGSRRLNQIPGRQIADIIRALRRVGLIKEARRFAVEVALEAGL